MGSRKVHLHTGYRLTSAQRPWKPSRSTHVSAPRKAQTCLGCALVGRGLGKLASAAWQTQQVAGKQVLPRLRTCWLRFSPQDLGQVTTPQALAPSSSKGKQ